jgi:hypothetical protein
MMWHDINVSEGLAVSIFRAKMKARGYTSTPPYVFMAWYLVKPKGNFAFT